MTMRALPRAAAPLPGVVPRRVRRGDARAVRRAGAASRRAAGRRRRCGRRRLEGRRATRCAAHWDILRQDLRYTRADARAATPGFAITAVLDRRARHRRDHGGVLGHRLRADPAAAVSGRRPAASRLWEADAAATRASSCRRPTIATGERPAPSFETHRRLLPAASANLVGAASRVRLDGARRHRRACFRSLGVAAAHSAGCSPPPTTATARPARCILSYRLWQTQFGGDPSVHRPAGPARRRRRTSSSA